MDGPPPLELTYACRVSALEKERRWYLSADTLSWQSEGYQDAVPLAEIQEIRLKNTPTRFEPNLYWCRIRTRGGKVWEWKSHHFAGFAQFQDRSATYRVFVVNLIMRVVTQNPQCTLIGGTSWLSWIFHALFLTGSLIALMVVMFFMYTAIGWLVIVKLIVIVFLLPRAYRWLMRNKPSRFSAREIPHGLLPPV